MKKYNLFGKEIYICDKEERDRIADALIWGGIYTDQAIRDLSVDIQCGKYRDDETVRRILDDIIKRKAKSEYCLRTL